MAVGTLKLKKGDFFLIGKPLPTPRTAINFCVASLTYASESDVSAGGSVEVGEVEEGGSLVPQTHTVLS